MHDAPDVSGSSRIWGAALLLGCGPRAPAAGETDGGTGGGEAGDESSTAGQDESEGDGSSTGWDICPCEEVPPAWKLCDEVELTAVDAMRELSEVTAIDDDASSGIVLHDGSLYVVVDPSSDAEGEVVQRWSPGDGVFAPAVTVEIEQDIRAIASHGSGLLLLIWESSGEDRLSRWTPEAGLDTISTFGSLDLGAFHPGPRAMRVGGGHVQFGLPARDHFDDAAPDSQAVVDVDLADGSNAMLEQPLAGFTPTDDGWWGRRATLGDYQYCFDYSCIHERVATSWDLLARNGDEVVASEGCILGSFGEEVTHAWVSGSDYVFVSDGSARRIDAAGKEHVLWAGGEIADAMLDGASLLLSLSYEVEDPEQPGAGRNELLRVDLGSGIAERLASAPIDDQRQRFGIGGVIDGRLYLSSPRPDRHRRLDSLPL